MVSFGEKAKIKRREIWIKVVVMLLQLYKLLIYVLEVNCLQKLFNTKITIATNSKALVFIFSFVWNNSWRNNLNICISEMTNTLIICYWTKVNGTQLDDFLPTYSQTQIFQTISQRGQNSKKVAFDFLSAYKTTSTFSYVLFHSSDL